MKITSREEARERSEKRYFTGVPCANGHVSERFTKDGKCTECNRLACKARHHRALLRDIERLNRSIRAAEARHKSKIRKEVSALKRIARNVENSIFRAAEKSGDNKYKTNRPCPHGHRSYRYIPSRTCCECAHRWGTSEERKEYDSLYRKNNAEKLRKRRLRYYAENKEKAYAQTKEWARKNRDKVRAIKHTYKIKRRAKEKDGVSSAELAKWVAEQKKKCYWCGVVCKDDYHIDHYMPLARGGLHELSNLVIACPSCNMRKNAKHPYEFAKEVGKLF